jgi:hypothetical protein
MLSDVKQWFVVTVKNIHATINIENGVLLKIRQYLCILYYLYIAKLLYILSFVVFKQMVNYFFSFIFIVAPCISISIFQEKPTNVLIFSVKLVW